MQAVLLAEVQRTMNTLRKTAVYREPSAIENGNGKLQLLPKTEDRVLQDVKHFSLPYRWKIYWYILLEEVSLVLRTS